MQLAVICSKLLLLSKKKSVKTEINKRVSTLSDLENEREVLSAKISKESADGWKKFCHGNGVSLTAMIEVAGLQLAEEQVPPKVEARKQMVELAREVDIARRSRKKR